MSRQGLYHTSACTSATSGKGTLTLQSSFHSFVGQNTSRARHDSLAEERWHDQVKVVWATRGEHICTEAFIARVIESFQPAAKMLALVFCQIIGRDAVTAALDEPGNERSLADPNVGVREFIAIYKSHDQYKDCSKIIVHRLVFWR